MVDFNYFSQRFDELEGPDPYLDTEIFCAFPPDGHTNLRPHTLPGYVENDNVILHVPELTRSFEAAYRFF